MQFIFLVAVTLVTLINQCHCSNSYVILLPKRISHGAYPISITYMKSIGGDGKITGSVKVTDPINGEEVALEQYEITAGNVPSIVNIQFEPSMARKSYNIEVTGRTSDGVTFTESATLTFEDKPLNIFIQTDRAVYKPSQTVNFRVLTVDAELKPKPVMLTVTIEDPKGNIIKRWQNQSEHAVFTEKFLLSDEPMNGDWNIKVVTEEEDESSKTFEVREYVLPKFEVTVEPPGYLLTTTKEFPVTVTAKYTYGKPVKGVCELRVHQPTYYWEGSIPDQLFKKELMDGKADFMAATTEQPRSWTNIEFSAVCTESLTNNAITANKSVKVYSKKYKVEFMKSTPANYKPGMTYKAYVLLSQADGSPPLVSDLIYKTENGSTKREMELSIKKSVYMWESSSTLATYKAQIDSAGIALFEIDMDPAWNGEILRLIATFTDGRYRVTDTKDIEAFFSRDDNYLQVTNLDTSSAVKVGELAKFKIKTSYPASEFYCVFFSRGKIVVTEKLDVSQNTEHIYEFNINKHFSKELSPDCKLVVWTVTEKDEILADSLSFRVDGAFSKQLQVSITPQDSQEVSPTDKQVTVTPGDPVTVRVKAEPSSYFGLLVVDLSSTLLGSNDITQQQVVNTLQGQDYSNCYPNDFIDVGRPMPGIDFIFDMPFYYGSCGARNSKEIFQNVGLFIKTDIHIDEGHATYPPTSTPTYPIWESTFMTSMFTTTAMMRTMTDGINARTTMLPIPSIMPDDDLDKSPESSGGSRTGGLAEVKRIRKDFPETWIFLDGEVNSNGLYTKMSTVPDSITTWIATAFTVHPETGLDVVDQPFELKAFKPFFVTLDLPYSVIRGEEFELKIIIQNYLKTSFNVRVTLEKSKDYFKVSAPSGDKYQFAKVWTDIVVPAGDGYTISIWIKPVELGNIPIEVKAQSSKMADAVRRKILVEPEGAPQEYTRNILIKSQQSTDVVEKVQLQLPINELVPDSLRVYASLVGDIMGQAMNNLDKLIRMPYGCGEQNMLNFAPNIFIMNYLKVTGQSNPKVKENALKYTEAGYQRELNYQRKDGCFSAFGDTDREGSTWLTAFVLKSFWQGRQYLTQPVNAEVEKGLKCLISKQDKSGQFVEEGVIFHKAMQGGTSSGVTLTAYVLIALLEIKDIQLDSDMAARLTDSLTNAEQYLVNKLGDPDIQTDPYTLAVIGYALSLADNDQVQTVFDTLKSLAKTEDGQMYWETQQSSSSTKTPTYYHKASTYNVETAAYALLMYVKLDKYLEGMSIADWLIGQRNPNGGYRSTQDTIMALQALTEIAINVYGDIEPSMDVTVKYNNRQWSFPQQLTEDTQLLLQTLELDLPEQEQTELAVIAKGKGTALIQVTVKYNVYKKVVEKNIKLNVTSEEASDGITDVNVCTSYHGDGDSGMVVMETMPLSGYRFVDLENVLMSVDGLKRVEQKQDKAVVYLDTVKKDGICVHLTQERVNFVANIKESRALAYSYYDTDEADSTFYIPQSLVGLNVCDTCPDCCQTKEKHVLHFVVDRVTSDASHTVPKINTIMMIIIWSLLLYLMK